MESDLSNIWIYNRLVEIWRNGGGAELSGNAGPEGGESVEFLSDPRREFQRDAVGRGLMNLACP
jgi:hypothetical protein